MGGFSTGTTFADSLQNNKARTTGWVQELNAQQQQIFDGAVANYNLNMQSGNMQSGQKHDPPLTPPVAPFAYVVSQPDANGYVWPVLSTTQRLTPTVPIATVDLGTVSKPFFPPFQPQVGTQIPGGGGKWFSAIPGDTFPNGQTTDQTTSADGVTGKFLKAGMIGPTGGWYVLVS